MHDVQDPDDIVENGVDLKIWRARDNQFAGFGYATRPALQRKVRKAAGRLKKTFLNPSSVLSAINRNVQRQRIEISLG